MRESQGYLATGFRDVDGNSDVAKMAACLGFLAGLPSFQAYKARSLEMMRLKPGQTVADLGCGLGFDLPEMARQVLPGGRVKGLDASRQLLAEAAKALGGLEDIELRQGDILALDFPSGTFDALRVDRTLQHVADPRRAIAEMHRVLKPGGWLVCAEPDWGTFVIDCQDIPTSELVAQRWRASFRNPHLGRGLPRMLREQGLAEVSVEGFILLAQGLPAVDAVYDVCKTVEMMREGGDDEQGRLAAWLEGLREEDRRVGVSASVTLFLAWGRKAG